jgi:PRTRC genetic system protein A
MNLVGYSIINKDRIHYIGGLAYDYIMAGDGLWVEAETPHIAARVQVAEAEVRGLMSLSPILVKKHGRIPQRFFDLAMSVMLATPELEAYASVVWEGGYELRYPAQTKGGGSVEYLNQNNTVFEMHSHGLMKPFFSAKDNTDEQGCRVYAVVGHLNRVPRLILRVGVYGYFQEVKWSDVFEGVLSGAVEGEEETKP